ncbi:hypothetical protein PG996_004982 [Apiospora saccharicola]|uniref:Heterokaryon incompatibility domain-containing protein n=1 Tax=Apiospora saccharicola TaxID=335842 RepID=A0ABR1VK76_9PEZI
MANDPRICDYCQAKVLLSNKPYGQHHPDAETWNLSLSQGCPFCTVLHKDMSKAQKDFPALRHMNAAYRWTIRPAGKMRESQEYIIVTFRPIVSIHISGSSDGTRELMERVFFLLPEDDLGHLPSVAELGPSTDSASSRRQVREWVDTCVRNHPQCNPSKSGPGFVPTRLVDLGEPGAEWAAKSVKIVNTKRDGIRARYVTLSHCWGRAKPFWNLRKAALAKSPVPEVPLADIQNKNIEEAITVARTIGIRYIWIDSLCIVQDDSDDWEREGQLMHKVYRNSHCNIAAADSSDGDGGLFRDRVEDPDQQSVPVRFMTPSGGAALFGHRAWRVLHSDLWQDEVLGRALYSRAWVFQERLLSPRLLHFSRGQIFWDCATLSASEAIPAGLPAVLDEGQTATDRHWRERLQVSAAAPMGRIIGTADDSLQAFWASAVLFYTSCNITRQSDRLRAVWGIAKLVRDAEREEFPAGLA